MRRRPRDAGQSLVEFALIAPVFFLVVLGLIDATRAVFAYNTIANASREGARYGIVHGGTSLDPVGPGVNEAQLTDHVKKYLKSFDAAGVSVVPTWPNASNATGSKVRVSVAYQYRPMFGGVVGIHSMTLNSTSTMVIVN